jgi:hypothetical protein
MKDKPRIQNFSPRTFMTVFKSYNKVTIIDVRIALGFKRSYFIWAHLTLKRFSSRKI